MIKVIPVMRVFDRAKTIEFYINWLGFRTEWEHRPEDSPFYMQVALKSVLLNLSEHHGDCSPGARIILAGFRGLQAYHEQLIGKNYKFMKPGLEKSAYQPDTLCMTVIDPFYNHITFEETL